MVSVASRPPYLQGKSLRLPFVKRMGRLESRSERFWRRESLLPLPAIEAPFLGWPTCTQSLYQLSYFSCRCYVVTYVLQCVNREVPLCAYRIYTCFYPVTIDPCKQLSGTLKCAVFSELLGNNLSLQVQSRFVLLNMCVFGLNFEICC